MERSPCTTRRDAPLLSYAPKPGEGRVRVTLILKCTQKISAIFQRESDRVETEQFLLSPLGRDQDEVFNYRFPPQYIENFASYVLNSFAAIFRTGQGSGNFGTNYFDICQRKTKIKLKCETFNLNATLQPKHGKECILCKGQCCAVGKSFLDLPCSLRVW